MLSLVVPAYKEGEHIYENLIAINGALLSIGEPYEIIPVNDGSPDNTGSEILRAGEDIASVKPVSYDVNRGKGGAIIEGISHAEGDVIGFIDADLDIDPDHVPDYLKAMRDSGCDIVLGSKMHKDSKLVYPFARRVFSRCYYIMLKVLFGLKCHDTQTGIKLYRGELIKSVAGKLRTRGYAFDIEILALCSRQKASLKEMPVRIDFKRGESFGRIRFRDIWKMFTDTIGIWWNLRVRKKYD